jgi:hypothetical protein
VPRALRIPLVLLALASVVATMWEFARETLPHSGARAVVAKADLSAADRRAVATPIDYADAIPVLSYRDVSTRPSQYAVSPRLFASQLSALRRAGFHTVSLSQVRDLVLGRHPVLPSRPILLSFDDGTATELTGADPVLRANGFSAVSFVVPGHLADGTKPSYYLSWPQVRQMRASGRWEFQTRVDTAAAVGKLHRATGRPIFAYSYPFLAASVPAAAERAAAGRFTLAFVSGVKTPYAVDARTDPLALPRYDVNARVDVPTLFDALRQMVPSPPASTPSGWNLSGTACTSAGDAIVLRSQTYALCPPRLNGGQWTDYRLTLTATGLSGRTTLVVLARSNADGDLEVSVGSRRTVLRQALHGHYTTLGDWTTTPTGPGGAHTVAVEVIGASTTVTVDGVALGTAQVAPALSYGGPGIGIAGGGEIRLTDVRASDLRSRASGP